jgi:hypothetical protein
MKKIYLLFIIGAVAYGCGDKDRYLFNQIPVEPVLNPNTKVLIKDASLTNVRLDSGNIIRGFTAANFFSTTNQFQNFNYTGVALPANKLTPFSYNRNTIVVASGAANAPVVQYSFDYGNTWGSVTPISFSPAIVTAGYNTTELVCASFIDSNNLMLAYQQKAATTADSRKFYKLNITTKVATRVSYFDDALYPVNIKFTDKKTGFMLLYKNATYTTYISRTLDTGRTWTAPVEIAKRVITGLQTGTKGNLCALEDYGKAYMSADSGKTWHTTSNENLQLTDAHMINNSTIIGLTGESLLKSTDTGTTWSTVSNSGYEYLNMKKLHFQDDQNGLMYGGQKLYITADGGVTWKVLLYPYSYVTE